MLKLTKALTSLSRKQRGLTTVEYAVAGGLLVAALIAAFVTLGGNVETVITSIADCIAGDCG